MIGDHTALPGGVCRDSLSGNNKNENPYAAVDGKLSRPALPNTNLNSELREARGDPLLGKSKSDWQLAYLMKNSQFFKFLSYLAFRYWSDDKLIDM